MPPKIKEIETLISQRSFITQYLLEFLLKFEDLTQKRINQKKVEKLYCALRYELFHKY